MVVLLFTLGASKPVRTAVQKGVVLINPNLAAYMPDLKPKDRPAQGGGGGGDRSPLPASKGRAPRFAARQFVPPAAVINNSNPKLLMEPTLIGQADMKLPSVDMNHVGRSAG